jgi:hypothetical protein
MNDSLLPDIGPDQRWFFLSAAALIAGAVYVVLVVAIALWIGNPRAAEVAAATEGLVYLNCMALVLNYHLAGTILCGLAIACGIAAGVLLVVL